MTKVRWEDLPPKATGRRDGDGEEYRAIIAVLRRRPGRWAVFSIETTAQSAASLAGRVRSGRYGAEVEAAARKVDGEFRVYARYVGGAP